MVAIDDRTLNVAGEKEPIAYFRVEPIRLTRELLREAGFYEPDRSSANELEMHIRVWESENRYLVLDVREIDGVTKYFFLGAELEYFHQLQNLHYTLTNTEPRLNGVDERRFG